MTNNMQLKEVIAELYLNDEDRFSVRLQEAMDFKSPYAQNKAFAQVGGAYVISKFSMDEEKHNFAKLDKETKKRVVSLADFFNEFSKHISLDGMKIDRAIKRSDKAAIEQEYGKALQEYVSNRILQKITPNLQKLFNKVPSVEEVKNYMYSKIAVQDTSKWQEYLVEQLGSSYYDTIRLNAFYKDFIYKYFTGDNTSNKDEKVDAYKKFLKENNSMSFVDARVHKYAELILKSYKEEYSCGITHRQIKDFAEENKDYLIRVFGDLINFVDDKSIRFNFVKGPLEKIKNYANAHATQSHNEKSIIKYVKQKQVIKNTPLYTPEKSLEAMINNEISMRKSLKVKPFNPKKTAVNFGEEDVLNYVNESIAKKSEEKYIDALDKKFITKYKRQLLSTLLDGGLPDKDTFDLMKRVLSTEDEMQK